MTETRQSGVMALTERQRWVSIYVVQFSVMVTGFLFGIVIPILSVILENDGVSTTLIGLNASMAMIAAVITGPFVPRVTRRIGLFNTIMGGLGILLASIILLPVFNSLGAWFPLRFLIGIGMVIHWSLMMTWLNAIVTEKNRGLALGINGALWGLGYAAGPEVIARIGLEGFTPFLISGGATVGSAILLLACRRVVPALNVQSTRHVGHAFRVAPIIMILAFVGGFGETGLGALLQVYGLHSGLPTGDAIRMISILTIGGVVLAAPSGWFADRMNRWGLLLGFIACGVVGPILLPFAVGERITLWPTLLLWGGMLVGIHSIGMTLLGQRFPASELAQANALFVMCFSAGAASGSFASGGAMAAWDPHGLPVLMGSMFALLLLVALLRRPWRDPAYHQPKRGGNRPSGVGSTG